MSRTPLKLVSLTLVLQALSLPFTLVSAFCSAPLYAQSTPTQAALESDMDAYLATLIELDVFAGVVLIARGDSILLQKAYGMADREHGVPLTPASVFRIASITKSFTRALAGRLAEHGRLELDAPIERWLPDFPGARQITLRMLLDHRAGVPNVNSLPYDEEALGPTTLAELVDSLAGMRLDFEPGSARRYSNGGCAVATRILELASGRGYRALLHEEILAPLGLGQTGEEQDGDLIVGRARGYAPSPVRFGLSTQARFQTVATKAGGGSMVSTAGDLHRWALVIGQHPVLSASSWADLFPAGDAWAQTGRSPGYNAALVRDGDLVGVVLANTYAAGMTYEVARAMIALAAGRAPEPLPVSAPGAAHTAIAAAVRGAYHLPAEYLQVDGVDALEIRQVGSELVVVLGDTPVDVLVPQGRTSFLLRSLWSIITVEEPVDGRAPGLRLRPLYRDGEYHAARIGDHAQ